MGLAYGLIIVSIGEGSYSDNIISIINGVLSLDNEW